MAYETFADALKRFGGMYGSAWRDGHMLTDVVEVGAAIEIGRIEVPLVGRTSQGYKPGRESREGSIQIQKVDTGWELDTYHFLSQSLATRRAARGTADAQMRQFSLKLTHDDPDTFGRETWQLDGCQIWRLPLGFGITDDIINREFPLTWDTETPLETFRVGPGGKYQPVHTL